MATENKPARTTDLKNDAEIDSEMASIDGINGAAGHRVEDPEVRAILRRQISGAITGMRPARRSPHTSITSGSHPRPEGGPHGL
jgi:hypothetical protein